MVSGLKVRETSNKFKSPFRYDHIFNKLEFKVYGHDEWNEIRSPNGKKTYVDISISEISAGILINARNFVPFSYAKEKLNYLELVYKRCAIVVNGNEVDPVTIYDNKKFIKSLIRKYILSEKIKIHC